MGAVRTRRPPNRLHGSKRKQLVDEEMSNTVIGGGEYLASTHTGCSEYEICKCAVGDLAWRLHASGSGCIGRRW